MISVYAVDLNPLRLKCAAQNGMTTLASIELLINMVLARVYGVADRINFLCGDFFHIAESFLGARANQTGNILNSVEAVFLSPPWGGPSYIKEKIFDLEQHITPNGREIFNVARKISPNICYFLPRNTDFEQVCPQIKWPNWANF